VGYNVTVEKIDHTSHNKAIYSMWSDEPFRRALKLEIDSILSPAWSTLRGSEDMNAIIKARGQVQALEGLMSNLEKIYSDELKRKEKK